MSARSHAPCRDASPRRRATIAALLLLLAACSDTGGPPDGVADTTIADTADTHDTAATDAGADLEFDRDADEARLGGDTAPDDADTRDTDDTDAATDDVPDAGDVSEPPSPRCDPIMPQSCAFPFPSSFYLEDDPERETGYTLRFGDGTLPANSGGQQVPSAPWERLDGYSVGVSILAILGDVDDSAFPGERDVAASMAEDAPIVLLEVSDCCNRRVPFWTEWAERQSDPSLRTLVVRPAEVLREDTRYIVAFRDLEYRDGSDFERSDAFERLLSGDTDDDPGLVGRQARFETIFGRLARAGVARESLSVAWDFHTASHEALHGPLIHMRDDALARPAPTFALTSVRRFAPEPDESGLPVDEEIAFEIEGTFTAPWYLVDEANAGRTGRVLNLDADGMPAAVGERARPFWMMIPHSALGGEPHLLVQYGHGLLGSGRQVFGSHNRRVAARQGLITYAAYMTGMSEEDVPSAMATATDAGRFQWLSDPCHQGLVEWVLLAHHLPAWLAEQPLFTTHRITIAEESPAYNGISQGGIFGMSFVALSPDVTRGHLGVPGNNYAILLERSLDFLPYFAIADLSYPVRHEQLLLLALVGMLWESTDPVSFVRHVSAEPIAGSPPNSVLLAPAKGDPEVAVVTNEVLARTPEANIPLMVGYGRDLPLADVASYPRTGSGIVLYDFGHPWPEPGMHPPEEYPELGDPHGLPKRSDHHNDQLGHFLWTGEIIDVCGGDGCTPE